MGRVEEILKINGPMLSGKLAFILEQKYSISNEAARKAISRARSPVQKLKVFPFNKNQVYCYLEEQYTSRGYRENLYESLKNESLAVSVILPVLSLILRMTSITPSALPILIVILLLYL